MCINFFIVFSYATQTRMEPRLKWKVIKKTKQDIQDQSKWFDFLYKLSFLPRRFLYICGRAGPQWSVAVQQALRLQPRARRQPRAYTTVFQSVSSSYCYTMATFVDFCPKIIEDKHQLLAPKIQKSEKVKVPITYQLLNLTIQMYLYFFQNFYFIGA